MTQGPENTQPDAGTGPEVDDVSTEGEVPQEDAPAAPAPEEPAGPTAEQQLAERTADLQRLQAEYVNYKRRVDRDRELVRSQGEAKVLESLLTVLDDIARAGQHGELEGGFKAVADSLQTAVTKHGLETFGATGDPFDPALHEAVTHAGESPDVDVTSVALVMRTGFRVGDRVLRTAIVGVVDPAAPTAETPEAEPAADQPDTDA
ncbi:nucleotide exchange factor GrpE [Aeromicrobium sp. Leaf350]|uniref:nucleotide exchange factor GrpE n=1 Tax=Aeromicrobium sp. Leaf350 TaxID=2876565 RepID=UPI001E4AAEBD|nr:nucleotide exchange factor GrpE [Aeromicrobium sp. Leaf350]